MHTISKDWESLACTWVWQGRLATRSKPSQFIHCRSLPVRHQCYEHLAAVFSTSSIFTTTRAFCNCREPRELSPDLVSTPTHWHQWNHLVLWGSWGRSRDRGCVDTVIDGTAAEGGHASILPLPVQSGCLHHSQGALYGEHWSPGTTIWYVAV